MTKDELLLCLTDRPCGACKFHTEQGCSKWSCVFEDKTEEWIPCEERLPEDDTLMLVNYIDHRPDAEDIWIGWHEMENVWYIDGEEHSKERGNEVVAWMPLPKPYEGRTE